MIRENFSTTFHGAWSAREKGDERFSIFSFLLAVIVIGAAAAWWLVYFRF